MSKPVAGGKGGAGTSPSQAPIPVPPRVTVTNPPVSPGDTLSPHFLARELFAPDMFPRPPEAELVMARRFCREVLEPLRTLLGGVPLCINGTFAGKPFTASGWRGPAQVQRQAGAAGDYSNHNLLSIFPEAVGAVDIRSSAVNAKTIALAAATLMAAKAIPTPREILWEVGWCHIEYPPEYKDLPEVRRVLKPGQEKRRPARVHNGWPPNLWVIRPGTSRRPLHLVLTEV